MTTHKPLSKEWLDQFADAAQKFRLGRDQANGIFGRLNSAFWIAEHADLLLNEIMRLKAELEAYKGNVQKADT